MKFEVQSTMSLMLLSIVNLCLCLQDFAEKTMNSISELSHNEIVVDHHNHHSKRHHHQQNLQHNNSSQHHNHHRWGHENFLLIDYLADGEMERRISWKGVTAKETTIGNNSKSLSLWQLSNGFAFIQMIYSRDDELIDCEYVREKSFVNGFLQKFYAEVDGARARNFTTPLNHKPTKDESYQYLQLANENYDSLENNQPHYYEGGEKQTAADAFGMRNLQYTDIRNEETDIPDDLKLMLNYRSLKMQCDERHQQLKKIVKDLKSEHEVERTNATEHLERRKRSLSDWFLLPNTKWCGRGHNAATYNELGGATKADKCCRRHDHCKFNIPAMTTKWNMFNYRPFTLSHCSCDTRQRRDLSNLFRVPGTKWCGKGYTAKKYTELGGLSKADRCCRQHDKSCPFWIMGFETKYGFFNFRVNTLMHCKCDERFRTCLKMADSSDATMVGKLFFNIVQTKCFLLKPERVCVKTSWWGNKCEKKVIRKRAHIRDNRQF